MLKGKIKDSSKQIPKGQDERKKPSVKARRNPKAIEPKSNIN
jgi:hypothetical protein